jgi:hypothetical protein
MQRRTGYVEFDLAGLNLDRAGINLVGETVRLQHD